MRKSKKQKKKHCYQKSNSAINYQIKILNIYLTGNIRNQINTDLKENHMLNVEKGLTTGIIIP